MPHHAYRLLVVTLVAALAAPGWAQCVPDQQQLTDTTYMAGFSQLDLAQSFQQTNDNICGASVKLRAGVGNGSPGDVTIALYDALPNQNGNLLISGTSPPTTAGNTALVSWPQLPITPGVTYFLVFTCTNMTLGLSGNTSNPYPFGQVYANSGYGSFPNFDYTFETYYNQASPPSCTLTAPGPLLSQDIALQLDSTSPNAPTVDATFEFSLDGGVTYSLCTAGANSPLPNPALGIATGPQTFEWDSRADGVGLFAVAPGVLARATVDDGVFASPAECVTQPFDVDNSFLCNGICGDCDQNASATPDILDALTAAQIAASVVMPTPQQGGCCDVDGSTTVDILDALLIAQFAALLPVTLACL